MHTCSKLWRALLLVRIEENVISERGEGSNDARSPPQKKNKKKLNYVDCDNYYLITKVLS